MIGTDNVGSYNYKQISLTLFYEINFMNRHDAAPIEVEKRDKYGTLFEMALKQIFMCVLDNPLISMS
jgi:hypothetical protein